jgi:hypothetical protein
MTCLGRAMILGQDFDAACRLRKDGANMARAMTDMLDALDRKRGKGPQVVRVERVVVHEGGQAMVGTVAAAARVHGWGVAVSDRTDNPMRRVPDWHTTLPMAQNSLRCGAQTRAAGICQQPAMRNAGRCRMHGGASTGPRTGEGLARMVAAKTIHGGRSAEAARFRQMLRGLRSETKRLVELVESGAARADRRR